LYKTTNYWFPEHEPRLLCNDPTIGVDWALNGQPFLAAKVAASKLLAEADCFD
jgi:dTDP-4-dehydrorhamnose 3,5-epimerase